MASLWFILVRITTGHIGLCDDLHLVNVIVLMFIVFPLRRGSYSSGKSSHVTI